MLYPLTFKGPLMTWDTIQGNWPHLTGQAKFRWDMLSGADLRSVAGDRGELSARIQERYGVSPEEAHAQVQSWEDSAHSSWLY